MKNTDLILNVLTSHFEKNGWPLDVNHRKLLDRFALASDVDGQGMPIVEIERHRPILGASYVVGSGMEAFETYFMRYEVDVACQQVRELPERHGSYDINVAGLVEEQLSFDHFDLSIEAIAANQYMVSESVMGNRATIATLDDLENFAFGFEDGFREEFEAHLSRSCNTETLSSFKRKELQSTYAQSLRAALTSTAGRLWDERDD